ncbi:MAG: AraC family transcriptional regulator [Spirochaetales bacterium]|uniref:AraC family transcriptional regulator n=1 Tax=Candidatus Thalassospirochaeta sargassi TaxID=3119039 RepID=A0AAJ1IGV0_9SPIO|nr:AraC family transcriptional regulator [Spirochaetales bacterium]
MQINISDAVFVYLLQDDDQIRWHSRTHTHREDEWEMHYFIQGEGSFKNAGVTRQLQPGAVFFSSPGEIHTVMPASRTNPITYYAILFRIVGDDSDFLELLAEIDSHHKNCNIGTNYRFFFEELKDKFLSHNRARVNSGIHQFISFLYMLTDDSGDFHYSDGSNSHIERSLRIMQNNVFNKLTLEELADKLKLNKSYFIRLFSKKMNTTPMKYFTRLKIEAASSMLISTVMPIYEISDKLCFYSEFHFSKSFKQYKGLSPRYYRANYGITVSGDY